MYGLVLEGGGTRGAYQIGAYEALVDLGLGIGGIAGTSIGAINGAMFAQGDLELSRELWENLDHSMVIKMEDDLIDKLYNLKFEKDDILYMFDKVKEVLKEGGLDISPLKFTLDKYIDEDRIRSSGKDFGVVTFNLSDLKPRELFLEDIPRGRLKEYILASAYLPVFKGERLNGSYYLDGAFYDNLPFGMLEKKGYEKLIIVRIHGTGVVKKPSGNGDYILIEPREDLGHSLEFNRDRVKYNIRLGYYDTLRVFKNLLGKRYYIEDFQGEEDFLKVLLSLTNEDIFSLGEILNISIKNPRRGLFENIIPKIAGYLDLDRSSGYRDIGLGLLEIKAEALGINRFRLYKFTELLELVANKDLDLSLKKDQARGILDRLREKVDQIGLINKEEALVRISNIVYK